MKRAFRNSIFGRYAAVLLLVASAVGIAEAQQTRVYREGPYWVEETTGDFNAARNIRVRSDLGSVMYDGSSSGTPHYVLRKRVSANSEEQARRIFDGYRFSVARAGDWTTFSGDIRGDWRHASVQMVVNGPRQQDLVKVSTSGGGDVSVFHLSGRTAVDTGGGNVTLDDIDGDSMVSSGGGNLRVGHIGGSLQLRSGGGNVAIGKADRNASVVTGGGNVAVTAVQGDLAVETGGGNITVKQVGGGLRVSTGGGTLELGDVGGQVAAETGGGSIRINSGGAMIAQTGAGSIQCYNVKRGLRASTGGGGIVAEFVGKKGDFSDSHLEAGVGDITVYLPSDLGVNVIASIEFANGHRIVSDFPGIKVAQSGGYGPQEVSAEGELNGGGPTLKLHTTTGNISLRRLKKLVSSENEY